MQYIYIYDFECSFMHPILCCIFWAPISFRFWYRNRKNKAKICFAVWMTHIFPDGFLSVVQICRTEVFRQQILIAQSDNAEPTQPNKCQKKNSIFSRLHYSNAMKRNDGIKKKKQINEERFDCKLRSKWKIEKHKKSHSGEGSIICARARSMHTWQSNDILICRF